MVKQRRRRRGKGYVMKRTGSQKNEQTVESKSKSFRGRNDPEKNENRKRKYIQKRECR